SPCSRPGRLAGSRLVTDELVDVDAAALLDLLVPTQLGPATEARLDGAAAAHALPTSTGASVLGRAGLHDGSRELRAAHVDRGASVRGRPPCRRAFDRRRGEDMAMLAAAPIERHMADGLRPGAWRRRDRH